MHRKMTAFSNYFLPQPSVVSKWKQTKEMLAMIFVEELNSVIMETFPFVMAADHVIDAMLIFFSMATSKHIGLFHNDDWI